MEEIPIGTIRVSHKYITMVPFIIINESDFDPGIHTPYPKPEIPASEPEPVSPIVEEPVLPAIDPTSKAAKTAKA